MPYGSESSLKAAAGRKRPDGFNHAVPDSVEFVMQDDRRVGVSPRRIQWSRLLAGSPAGAPSSIFPCSADRAYQIDIGNAHRGSGTAASLLMVFFPASQMMRVKTRGSAGDRGEDSKGVLVLHPENRAVPDIAEDAAAGFDFRDAGMEGADPVGAGAAAN